MWQSLSIWDDWTDIVHHQGPGTLIKGNVQEAGTDTATWMDQSRAYTGWCVDSGTRLKKWIHLMIFSTRGPKTTYGRKSSGMWILQSVYQAKMYELTIFSYFVNISPIAFWPSLAESAYLTISPIRWPYHTESIHNIIFAWLYHTSLASALIVTLFTQEWNIDPVFRAPYVLVTCERDYSLAIYADMKS